MHKKGLSDVVTTVLIILLVVAAVSAVWVFIQPTLKNAGKAIDKGQICISSSVEPITCKGNSTSGYNIGYKRITDEKVLSLGMVKLNVELSDGTFASASGSNAIANGEYTNGSVSVASGKTAKQVTIVTEYNTQDGQKQTCTSMPLICTTI